jgi:DUF971 family protein
VSTVFKAKDIQIKNDLGVVLVVWADGHQSLIPIQRLRGYCPCAMCQGHEVGALKWIDNKVSAIFDAELVGRYAIHFKFGDGHNTGIYRWEVLRKMDPAEEVRWGSPALSGRGG